MAATSAFAAAARSITATGTRRPLDFFVPTPPQKRWMRSRHKRPMLRGPNQAGKTAAAAAELLHRMRGTHPYKQTHAVPIAAWMVCTNWKQAKTIMRKVYELCPKDELAKIVKFTNKNGFTGDYLELKNGSWCRFVTVNQETEALASETLHYIGIDEPPPEHLWSELLARVRHHNGTIAFTLTPVNQPVEWLKKKADEGELEDHQFALTLENCTPEGGTPFTTQKKIDAFRRECLAIDRAQRCEGAWEGRVEGQFFEAYSESLVLDDIPADKVCAIGVGIDHGAKAGRQRATLVAVLVLGGHVRVWAMDECATDGRSSSEDDAASILGMLKRNGIALEDVDLWIGDRAHGGDWYGNAKSNRDLKRAISMFTKTPLDKLPMPLRHMAQPRKRNKSVVYGARLINKLMAQDLCHISPKCKALNEAFRYWKGESDDPHKDAIDSFRYPIERMVDGIMVWGDSYFAREAA